MITRYPEFSLSMKSNSRGYVPNKSLTFERDEISKFLIEADDADFLQSKLVVLLALYGGLRRCEAINLKWDDVENKKERLKIIIRESKTSNEPWFYFAEANENKKLCPVYYFEKYSSQVPQESKISNGQPTRLILQYARNSPKKYSKQPRGKFWFCEITQKIASFLGKVEIKRYRFHGLRRTAATWLANRGISVIQLKHFGRWKSSSVAEGYIQESETSKIQLAQELQGESHKSKEENDSENNNNNNKLQGKTFSQYPPNSFIFQKCSTITNCTFQIVFSKKNNKKIKKKLKNVYGEPII